MLLPRWLKRVVLACAILLAIGAILAVPAYFIAERQFQRYFARWGERLVDMEKRGLLSTEFGAAWQDLLANQAMQKQANRVTAADTARHDTVAVVDGVRIRDYPSLSLVRRLNEITAYSNTIEIVDRRERPVAVIRTDHTRGKLPEFPPTLVTALVAAEDDNFWKNGLGFEFRSYVRAVVDALRKSVTSLRVRSPQGTSTITQQVAKLFISQLDDEGRRQVSRSVDRKLREMRIAAALRKMYTPQEILEVYLNHCVTSDQGLVGYKDIAAGLFGKKLAQLSDAECIYLARIVKWGRNVKPKIARQCRIDMPRMAAALGWDRARQDRVLAEVDSLDFQPAQRIDTKYGLLVDCANEYWQAVLRRRGVPESDLADFNIIDPGSLVRKKGNLRLRLTIDLPLQQALEQLVAGRGYGGDTVIANDVRIGSSGEDVTCPQAPQDTLRYVQILSAPAEFSEPESQYLTRLAARDTLISNMRYKRVSGTTYRRSVFYYTRRVVQVDGQYYAYAIMDSRTGKLLAYCSRDRIGSRLAGLLRYRTPNGSSTAKPILNALNFDLGTFKPYDSWNDSLAVTDAVAWRRSLDFENGKLQGVVFEKSAVRGRGYPVHNHNNVFEGCQYIYNHLAASNNILGVESCYRLDRQLFDRAGEVLPEALALVQYFYRIGAFNRIRNELRLSSVTGVRVYKELARLVGAQTDSVTQGDTRVAVSDSLYSVALGTLELTLLEQMHLFNVLYNNDLVEQPAEHPSLFVDSIVLNNQPVPLNDTVRLCHPFNDVNNLRPTYLGLHKRLISSKWDGLADYDIAYAPDTSADRDTVFSPGAFVLEGPLSNFAKSGTTDDIIRPFYVDVQSGKRTNYGLWNAVLRLDLARLTGDSVPEICDVTIACIGECSERYTGVRDGKTLHGFVTRGLLKSAGIKSPGGFYARYETYLKRTTPAAARNCGRPLPASITAAPDTLKQAGD